MTIEQVDADIEKAKDKLAELRVRRSDVLQKNKRVSPLKAIRLYCLDLNGGDSEIVKIGCTGKNGEAVDVTQPLYPYRFGRRPAEGEYTGVLPVLKAIRANCMECCGGYLTDSEKKAAIKGCRVTSCDLHRFRMGKNPNRKGIGGGMKNIDTEEA
jgi:hypothetical protein